MQDLKIQRLLTDTPLARDHAHRLEHGEHRAPPRIPWERFDRGAYPADALRFAAALQRDLAGGELLAVDSFARVASALVLVGAPLDLVAAAARVPSDEVRHAEYNLRMLALLEGRALDEVHATITGGELVERADAYSTSLASYATLDDWMLDVPTFGETVACGLLLECGAAARDVTVAALFRSIAADEVHHARLGWYYLAWRSPHWSVDERRRLAGRVAHLLASVTQRFVIGRDAPAEYAAAARSLGVLDTATQRAAVARIVDDELRPGLVALGLASA